jgi:abhydrolase domain-containing protein 12
VRKTIHTYQVTLIYAEDDTDIPWDHTPTLFLHTVNASYADGVEDSRVRSRILDEGRDIGTAGHVAHWHTNNGVESEYVPRHSLYDMVIGSPIVSLAVIEIFRA